MMKYEVPNMELIHFEEVDVITASDGGTGSGDILGGENVFG